MQQISRRKFMLSSAAVCATAGLASVSVPSFALADVLKDYPIPKAPLANYGQFWAAVTPNYGFEKWTVAWEVAEQPYFENIVQKDKFSSTNMNDELLNICMERMPAGKKLCFPMNCDGCYAQQTIGQLDVKGAKNFVFYPNRDLRSDVFNAAEAPTLVQAY